MDKMVENVENFYKELDLAYRVANVVSGALDKAAAKKVIIEAWFLGSGEFRELLLEGLQVMILVLTLLVPKAIFCSFCSLALGFGSALKSNLRQQL
jgi:hypothetical protein